MPRPPRADEAGGLYHAPNRGNARTTILRKDADYEAFERILAEGLERYGIQFLAFELKSAKRGSPFGEPWWIESTVKRLGLESTLRPRGRPQVRFPDETPNKES